MLSFMSRGKPPDPNEWHPAYEHVRGMLTDWLNGQGQFRTRDVMQIPEHAKIDWLVEGDINAGYILHTLRRSQAWGLAPYTGTPFFYYWWAAVDELGRGIAVDSRPVYGMDRWQ